jgi:hypothetical protein
MDATPTVGAGAGEIEGGADILLIAKQIGWDQDIYLPELLPLVLTRMARACETYEPAGEGLACPTECGVARRADRAAMIG